jgi:transketolase
MAVTAAFSADPPAGETADLSRAAPSRQLADAIRVLAFDAFEVPQSGYPGLPMADVATTLWTGFLRFDADDPRWPDRDRFVVSAGHASLLLYALLHLTGHAGVGVEVLRRSRQLQSPATGHLAFGEHPAIETTTGPFGQGLATGVGMALAERLLAARFGKSLVDHRTWVIACEGDLMEGISHEATGLAGQLRLERLTVLYDDSAVARSDDPLKRFAAHGWAIKQIDGHNAGQIAAAMSWAVRSKKPTLIACRTGIEPATGPGFARGLLGKTETARRALGWEGPPFTVPEPLAAGWRAAGSRGAGARRAWLKRLARHPLRVEFERVMAGRLPDTCHEIVTRMRAEISESRAWEPTGRSSRKVLETLTSEVPELVGGSAKLSSTGPPSIQGMGAVGPGNYGGRYIHFGAREHGMAAAANGMALHGGLIPFAVTSLAAADHMRPALRLGASMRQRVIHVLTQESVGVGEDGPGHEYAEHLASVRAMPGVHVFRPADAVETAECWELAIRRDDGPSLLVLAVQAVPNLRTDAAENRCARGGYVLAEAEGARRATLIATGSEVSLAMTTRAALAAEGIAVAVVSLPCWELFSAQDEAYLANVLDGATGDDLPDGGVAGGGVPRFGIEVACGFGWERWLGPEGTFIGVAGYGDTLEAIAAAVRKRLS